MFKSLLFTVALLCLSMTAQAVESPTMDLGKTLFESTELGTTGRSCSTCHTGGKGLNMIGDFNDIELKEIINACIRDALIGQIIAIESQEMDALLKYVRTYQKN